MTDTADSLRASAAAHLEAREASFERSDTDGFVSQWASGICASRDSLAAEILENGGTATFPGLFSRETGERVPAVLIRMADKFRPGQDRQVWRIEDPATGRAVAWVNHSWGTKRSAIYRDGYVLADEQAPAEAFIDGRGHGLSGSAWASVRRTDGGYPGRRKGL